MNLFTPISKRVQLFRAAVMVAGIMAVPEWAFADTVNKATVSAPAGIADTNTSNNSSTDTNTVAVISDLVVTKSNGLSSVNASGSTTYVLRVTNNGPSPVTGATLVDAVATGLSKTAVTCSAAASNQCSTAPSIASLEAGTVSLPLLASGAFYELNVTADVTVASGSVTNAATATVPVGATDPDTANNTGSDTDPAILLADLVVVKDNGGTTVVSGATTTYTMTVTNNGPSAATGAVVTDTVGSNLDCPATNIVSITGDGVPAGSFTVGQLTGAGITLGTLGPGQSAILNFTCNIP